MFDRRDIEDGDADEQQGCNTDDPGVSCAAGIAEPPEVFSGEVAADERAAQQRCDAYMAVLI